MRPSFNISIEDVMPGMILNEDIIISGNLLLPKGAVIKPSYISQLVSRGIRRINVNAEKSQYKDLIKNPVERFYAEAYEDIGVVTDSIKAGKSVSYAQLYKLVDSIIDKVYAHKNSLLLLTGLRGKCDYYYAHSLDVCIYSIIAANALRLECDDVINLGLGALLHDIGKTMIPDGIIMKKGILSKEEFNIVKKHSEFGYSIVGEILGNDHSAAMIVLQHHERCDGSGYPFELRSEETYFLSQIVAVADIYDALTSDKVYRKKILPHEAAEYLLCISNSLINSEIADVFLKNIALYPKGCQVLLNTNEIAVVLDSNPGMPLRPKLKIFTNQEKNPLSEPYELDLQSHPGIFIVHMFN
jgi:HD-GYP domain